MTDKIEVAAQASGEDGINRVVSAIERLEASLSKLGNTSALDKLTKQMATMNKTLKAGFDEMLEIQTAMESRSERAADLAAARRASQAATAEERIARVKEAAADRQLNADRIFAAAHEAGAARQLEVDVAFARAQQATAEKAAATMVAINQKRDVELNNLSQRAAGEYVSFWDRAMAQRQTIQEKRDAELHALAQKSAAEYVGAWEKMLAERQAIQERRDAELHNSRQREFTDYVAFWEKELAAQEVAQAKQLALDAKTAEQRIALAAAAAEKQRVLNSNFVTSPLSSQIATAERAQVYSSMGGNAADRFGAAAAAADIAALRQQHALLPAAVRASSDAMSGHNAIMNEGHALARGLAGSLGGLWLTYGSLVPLAAGAALAGSLKAVVTAGKDVEYQLKFVEALGSGGSGVVSLDQFLNITSGTIVSVKDAAEGMRALAQNGLDANESLKVLPTILNLAVIGEMGVASAALAVTGAVSAFNLQMSDADRVANVFAKAAATSNTSVAAMTESMKQASTVAGIYGASVDETAAALGVLAKVNITGTAAGTAYTNMLTNLYTPTEKAKKALAELKLTTDDGNGGLKNSTVLLTELRAALAGYNDTAKATLLGDIFTVRGQKGVSTILQNWDDYKVKMEEARDVTNFTSEAIMKLEDSTEGATRRLANAVSGTLTKAFESSAPALQEMLMHLGDLAKSEKVVSMLTGMADAVLRLTTLFIDHAQAIGLAVAAYTGMRVLSALPAVLSAVTTATGALTISMRGLTAAMGWIGVALAAASVAYELFINKTSDVEKADQRRLNSINTVIEGLDREIDRLEKRNQLWNPETKQFDRKGPVVDNSAMPQAISAYDKASKDLDAVNEKIEKAKFGNIDYYHELMRQQEDLEKRKQQSYNTLSALTLKQEAADVAASVDSTRRRQETTAQALAGAVRQWDAYDKASVNYIGREDARMTALAARAKTIQNSFLGGDIGDDEATKKLNALKTEASALLDSRAPKADKKRENDMLGAKLAAEQLLVTLQKLDSQAAIADAHQQNKRGEIGDLQMINIELEQKIRLNNQEAESARKQMEMASGADKLAKTQNYNNKVQAADKQTGLDTRAAEEQRQTYFARMQQEELKFDADTMKAKGQNLDAFKLEYEATYKVMIAKTTADMIAAQDTVDEAKFQKHLEYLNKLRAAGEGDATFKDANAAFSAKLDEVKEKLATAKAAAQEDGGLSGALGLSKASDDIQTLLPNLRSMADQLSTIAKDSGVPALVSAAEKAKTSLAGVSSDLTKAANPFGNAWTDAWKGIENSAHSAWLNIGKGGTNAFEQIGKVLKSSIMEMLYQLTIKQWVISIGANISSYMGMGAGAGAAGAAGAGGAAGAIGQAGGALSSIGSIGNMASSASTLYGMYGAVTGTGLTAMTGTGIAGAATGFVSGLSGSAAAVSTAMGGAELSGAAALGSSVASGATAVMAAIPVWGWAALAAVALYSYFGDSGPEDHTRIGFTSNNTAGNISINERGNEGKSNTYIGNQGTTSSLGTFGVSSSFWAQDQSKTVTDFLSTVSKTDDALAAFMTTTEKASVSGYLTGKTYTANTGAEGEDPNAHGELDGVFRDRIHNIFEGLGAGMGGLVDNFKGTSQELATEAGAILKYRQALTDSGAAVFGMKTSLMDIAALRRPTESTSEALVRITGVFNLTNQVAAAAGVSAEKMFGGLGISTFAARDNLIQMAGGIDKLSSQITNYTNNFLSDADKLAPAQALVDKSMKELGLSSVKTRDQFKDAVTAALQSGNLSLYASLMGVADAFAQVTAAAGNTTKTVQQVADEAKNIQDQIDQLTMTRVQLLQKERAALDPANRALFDQLQLQKTLADAKTELSAAYDREVTSITAANDRLATFGDSMAKFRDGLSLGSASPLTPEQKYAEARRQYESTLAKAKGGDTKAQDSLESVITAFLDASKISNASGAGYTADFNLAQGAADQMSQWAADQVDVGKASLEALRTQVSALTELKAAVLTLPEAIAAVLSAQADIKNSPVAASMTSDNSMAAVARQIAALTTEVSTLREEQAQQAAVNNEVILAANEAAAKKVVGGYKNVAETADFGETISPEYR